MTDGFSLCAVRRVDHAMERRKVTEPWARAENRWGSWMVVTVPKLCQSGGGGVIVYPACHRGLAQLEVMAHNLALLGKAADFVFLDSFLSSEFGPG